MNGNHNSFIEIKEERKIKLMLFFQLVLDYFVSKASELNQSERNKQFTLNYYENVKFENIFFLNFALYVILYSNHLKSNSKSRPCKCLV